MSFLSALKYCFIILFITLITHFASAEIYQWVDENNITHFSQDPPPGKNTQQIIISQEEYRSIFKMRRSAFDLGFFDYFDHVESEVDIDRLLSKIKQALIVKADRMPGAYFPSRQNKDEFPPMHQKGDWNDGIIRKFDLTVTGKILTMRYTYEKMPGRTYYERKDIIRLDGVNIDVSEKNQHLIKITLISPSDSTSYLDDHAIGFTRKKLGGKDGNKSDTLVTPEIDIKYWSEFWIIFPYDPHAGNNVEKIVKGFKQLQRLVKD